MADDLRLTVKVTHGKNLPFPTRGWSMCYMYVSSMQADTPFKCRTAGQTSPDAMAYYTYRSNCQVLHLWHASRSMSSCLVVETVTHLVLILGEVPPYWEGKVVVIYDRCARDGSVPASEKSFRRWRVDEMRRCFPLRNRVMWETRW